MTLCDVFDLVTDGLLAATLVSAARSVPQISDGYLEHINGTWMVVRDCEELCGQINSAGKKCAETAHRSNGGFNNETWCYDCCTTEEWGSFACFEEGGFTETFCLNEGIETIAMLSIVAAILGSCSTIAIIRLRSKELRLLREVSQKQPHFVHTTESRRRVTPSTNVQHIGEESKAEVMYRRLSKLKAKRAGKIASLLSLFLEDAMMFVVNGECIIPPNLVRF